MHILGYSMGEYTMYSFAFYTLYSMAVNRQYSLAVGGNNTEHCTAQLQQLQQPLDHEQTQKGLESRFPESGRSVVNNRTLD